MSTLRGSRPTIVGCKAELLGAHRTVLRVSSVEFINFRRRFLALRCLRVCVNEDFDAVFAGSVRSYVLDSFCEFDLSAAIRP